MAIIGQQLKQPEEGWKRYDDLDPSIVYSGPWTDSGSGTYYNNTKKSIQNVLGSSIKFNFIGSKLRLIGRLATGRGKMNVIIDNQLIATYSQAGATTEQALDFEKLDLDYKFHKVELIGVSSGNWYFDAIDIDVDGRLLHPDEIPYKFLFEHLGEFYTYNEENDGIESIGGMIGEGRSVLLREKGFNKLTLDVLNKSKTSNVCKSKIIVGIF